jgi:hypothetical protein
MKCFMDQQRFFFDKDAFDRREKLLVMPLKELPSQDLKDYGGFALRQADWAARLDTPDWQVLLKLKTDGVSLLLPDVQSMRALANALKARLRAEIAQGRTSDALKTARTMFALARHMAVHPTMIGELVGISIAYLTIGPLEELLEQPGCPNLYWALTSLPVPMIAIEKGIEGERALVAAEFRDLDDSFPMSAQQLQPFITHMETILGEPAKPLRVREWLDARSKDQATVAAARGRLIRLGLAEERVSRFSVDQILLIDEKREYEIRRDHLVKIMNVPHWQAETRVAAILKANEAQSLFASVLVEGIYGLRRAQGRLDQRIALLRSSPIFPSPCPTIPLPASHSVTKSSARRLIYAVLPRRPSRITPVSIFITKSPWRTDPKDPRS